MPAEYLLPGRGGEKETDILQAQTVAISIAINFWQILMSPKRVVIFTDNEPVRSSIIKRYSQNIFVDRLMGDFSGWKNMLDDTFALSEHLASHCDAAEERSRAQCTELLGSRESLSVDVMDARANAARSTGGDSAAKE